MIEKVGTVEDALRVASEMATKLSKQMNTLSYKLLRLSLVDLTGVRAQILQLDSSSD